MKKQYIVPSTCEAELLMESMILSGSPTPDPLSIPIGTPGDSFSDPHEFA